MQSRNQSRKPEGASRNGISSDRIRSSVPRGAQMKEIRERDIEKYLVKRVKEAGGEIRKVAWLGRRGAPDRVVFLHGSHWVELKAPGEKPRPEQTREHTRMGDKGAHVHILESFTDVNWFVGRIMISA